MRAAIERIVSDAGTERGSLIPILQRTQEELGYLSREAVAEIGRRTGISENEIFGTASFYAQFRFRPPGRHRIKTCLGTACHVRGGRRILAELAERLGIEHGETTPDGEYDLERVACLGCCALAPVVVVDDVVQPRMTPLKASRLVRGQAEEKE